MRKAAVVIVSLLGFSTVCLAARPFVADTTRTDSVVVVEEYTSTPSVPAALLQERLPKLQKTIPLPYHKTVHGFVDHFLFRKPSYTRTMLERMPMFFPLYERLLAQYNLPDELKYLSIVESGLNPRAVSHAGAGGLWQFMPGTGRDMRLYQDDYVDERMEPVKATEAACKYLRDLYRIFGNWPLALAAYNSGPGTVKRAMRRSGGDSFWTTYDYLPKETRAYVPQFIAFTYVINYAADHGITPEAPDYPIPFDTIHVNNYFNVVTFAKQTGIPVSDMQKLNPHITTGVLPPYTRNFMLRVPSDQFAYFERHRKAILDSASRIPNVMDHILLADTEGVQYDALKQVQDNDRFSLSRLSAQQPTTLLASNAPVLSDDEPAPDDVDEVLVQKPKKITYVVKKGEGLFRVAERFGVELYDLKKWNKLTSNTVAVGQKLIILKDVGETQAEALADQGTPKATKTKSVAARKPIKTRYHRVQQGDTLWNIAQRYDGLTIEQLKKVNKIRGNALKPGQKLIVG
ncbi:LysM peptidoglycan-binding domain-containing protein [Rudanella paleaurantiibacter]|uniref:LysM peptidoglycan-binding domain-containing protein n=1 Tax=Rudanella paleaurantiibacter TaxID=2614655 RepID=A0A7J5U469_9BACT|nr:lytic transglycosylase domain-containing protein [Rudanella paleaurantiibacter]KAB7732638.1 LysM peptidoglycan-binding domain-containing protein [Rudanella paleaurantiibacter]